MYSRTHPRGRRRERAQNPRCVVRRGIRRSCRPRPRAEAAGVDFSQAQVRLAQQTYPDLQFIQVPISACQNKIDISEKTFSDMILKW